ncbi:CRISPR-associated protein Cas2 [Alkaliphilus hydrothermalis]|uniref:CRISPR-associated endoribonuclease Cas2 n=2 Tax=Alkaliphilus hydrothermalis TaxID=1482730 RepID=A0ABS2NS35_9FIRM|nr:CRISPR-associated protein Cas2 [Alkaliphilus hydrothermalis]
MRILVLFDLPTKEEKERKEYQRFRKFLIEDGYDMMQYSIYMRICNGLDSVDKHIKRLKCNLPPRGAIRCLTITEKQFASMLLLLGKPSKKEEKIRVEQLSLF